MIFLRLTLQHFRQFAGTHTIDFAPAQKSNVTVIHGANGSGKTTLLNAFTWLLYEKTSPDFEDAERIESEKAFSQLAKDSELTTYVELEFEDHDLRYTARRSISVRKDGEGNRLVRTPTALTLKYIDDRGEVQEPNNPQNYIEHLMPPALSPFFFFNGERIERLAGAGAYDEVENGVKVLLDIELFDRSITHLEGETSKKLRDEITSHSGDAGRRAKEERDAIDARLIENATKIEQCSRNQKSMLTEKEAIDQVLNTMPELAKLQAERKAAEEQIVNLREQHKTILETIRRNVSRDGYLILTPNVLTKAQELLDAAHERGELPIRIKRQFVDELLDTGICICGRELHEGTAPRTQVMAWRNKAGSEDLESAVTWTKAEIQPLLMRRKRAIDELDRLQGERSEIKRRLRAQDELRDELSAKIGAREHGEDPAKLESRRREVEQELMRLAIEARDHSKEREDLERKLKDADDSINKLVKGDEAAKLAERRLTSVRRVVAALRQIRQLRHEDLHKDLSRRLTSVWGRIAIKDYEAHLDEEFHLHLTKNIGGSSEPVRGASTGEKQVLSLAFVGSLVEKACATYDEAAKDPNKLFRGGRYPIVMDSAFGNLEAEYRRDVAKAIPSIAPQVIILVSETQWRHEVEEELEPRIGKEYVLKLGTQKKRARPIRLRNRDYEYIVESTDGFEETGLAEVTL